MPTVVFRVNSGPKVGLGHLQRCLSLASALSAQSMQSHFVIMRDGKGRASIEEHGYDVTEISETAAAKKDLEVTLKKLERLQGKVVVVDCRCAGTDYLRELRRTGYYVVSIDDLAEIAFPSHLVINGNVYARKLSYRADSEGAVFLLGPEYAILDDEFWHISRNKAKEAVGNVSIILGGSDIRSLTGRLLRLLDGLPGKFSVTAIVGPYCQIVQEVEKVASQCSRLSRVIHAPQSLKAILSGTDLAISGGGQTLNMLARVGCPTVAVEVAPDQRQNIETLAEVGAVRAVRLGRNDELDGIRDAVVSLLWDTEARQMMGTAGQRLIDGQGALRVSKAIVSGIGGWQDDSA